MNHIKLQISAIGIAFSALLSGSSYAATSVDYGDNSLIADNLEILPELISQEEALNAYNTLYGTFAIDENYNYVLPDDYAGEYINDDQQLVIQLTTDDYSEYQKILSDYSCVVYNTVKYSCNELSQLVNESRIDLIDEIDENCYVISGVDVVNNSAFLNIGVESLNENTQTYCINNADTPLSVNYVETSFDLENDCELLDESDSLLLTSSTASLIGGQEIKNANYYYTLGICGTYN